MTPVILTLNEEENIGRTLESLRAFPRVVVVDSGSRDGTEALARGFSNVAWFSRPWSGFRDQWQFALRETGISSPFVLALDADMQVTPSLIAEIEATATRADVDGAILRFEYRIRGVRLAGSLYPAQLRLLRLANARAGERGHAHVLEVPGRVVTVSARLVHDDRKPLDAFVRAQLGYSEREAPRLMSGTAAGWPARVRRVFPFTPIAVWALAWVRAGGPFKGAAARRYALERLLYETVLRWRVEDEALKREAGEAKPARIVER